MKRKVLSIAAAIMICGALSACTKGGAQERVTVSPTETVQESSESPEQKTEVSLETESAQETETSQETKAPQETKASQETAAPLETASSKSQTTGGYEDNFAVEETAVMEYGERIKEAVNAKDIEALADLTGFPVYMGFPEESKVVNTREEFIALGTDRIFTQEFIDSVGNADLSGQQASMAGFVMMTGDGPNVIFGVVNGELFIQGYNY